MVVVRGKTRNLLEKAKESCILAVDVYNKPNTSFRSGAYIVLMTIAWTSLFHAIFYRKGVKYYYKESPNSRYYIKIDGQPKAWELGKCAKEYFKTKDYNTYLSVHKNIDFFIPIRNQIEHTFMPELDSEIFGECQSLLFNFERILIEEFGENHSINESLTFSLQFAKAHLKEDIIHSKEFLRIKDQIKKYRADLPDEIYADSQYSFKAALIPVNNPNRADCAIKFINLDDLEPEQKKQLENVFGFVKEKYTKVPNLGYLKSGEVAKEVQKELSKHYGVKIKFNAGIHHNKCCLEYGIRPKKGSKNKMRTNDDFCVYDDTFEDYAYSPAWVKRLIKELSNKNEFIRLFPNQQKEILGLLLSKDVTKNVKRELNKIYGNKIKFGSTNHLHCCLHYGIRPPRGQEPNVNNINNNYCVYEGHNNYLYTQEWVDFLSTKLIDETEFLTLFPSQKDLISVNQ